MFLKAKFPILLVLSEKNLRTAAEACLSDRPDPLTSLRTYKRREKGIGKEVGLAVLGLHRMGLRCIGEG